MKELMLALHQRPVAYYPIYKDITGSTTAGILLSQLMYWWQKVGGREFYKTDAEIIEETHLSEQELKTAKKALKQLSFIQIKAKGSPAKTFYSLDIELLSGEIKKGEKRQTRKVKSTKPERLNQPNCDGEINQTKQVKLTKLLQETTQETTTGESFFNEKVEPSKPTLFEVEKKEEANLWFPEKDKKFLTAYLQVFEQFKIIANRHKVQASTKANYLIVLKWLKLKYTPEDIVKVLKDRIKKVDPQYHELNTLLKEAFFENTLNRIKETEEKQSPMSAITWKDSQNAEYKKFCEWYTHSPGFTPPTENEYFEFIETGYDVFEAHTVQHLRRICLEAADFLKGKTASFKQLLTDYQSRNNAVRRAN